MATGRFLTPVGATEAPAIVESTTGEPKGHRFRGSRRGSTSGRTSASTTGSTTARC